MTTEKAQGWLDQLPIIDDRDGHDRIVLDGFLLGGPPGRVRLVAGEFCFEFNAADLLSLEERELPDGIREGFAIPVRAGLRQSATLLDLYPSHAYRTLLYAGRRPFALAVRPTVDEVRGYEAYRALEREFLNRQVSGEV
jgi:hypothetical protein